VDEEEEKNRGVMEVKSEDEEMREVVAQQHGLEWPHFLETLRGAYEIDEAHTEDTRRRDKEGSAERRREEIRLMIGE
jgi:hypothetical protein